MGKFKNRLIRKVVGLYGEQNPPLLRKSEVRGIVDRINAGDATWLRELVEGAMRVQREADIDELERYAKLHRAEKDDNPRDDWRNDFLDCKANELHRLARVLKDDDARVLRARLDRAR